MTESKKDVWRKLDEVADAVLTMPSEAGDGDEGQEEEQEASEHNE